MNNTDYFKKQAFYWAKRLNIKLDDITTDSKMWYICSADWTEDKNSLCYQPKKLKYERKYFIMHIIFHELGHFKDKNFSSQYPYDLFTNKMICEYKAESFALKCLKKYCPEYYKQFCSCIKNCMSRRLRESDYLKYGAYYFYAFSQIPEYAEHL